MPFYEYVCAACAENNKVLEEEQPTGQILLIRSVEDRNNEVSCPECKEPMARRVAPNFTTRWVSSKSSKRYPILEGPTQNTYLRGDERKKKQRREESRRHFDLIKPEAVRELKEDAKKAPSATEVPSPGVSVGKG